jgi:hypothetical protein
MHVGWVAESCASAEKRLPSFEEVRRHVERRVGRAPRYRQKLAPVPFPLQATYPVVPLADRHALSIGMTTIGERACFGVYADREALPDAGALAADIDDALSELLVLTPSG